MKSKVDAWLDLYAAEIARQVGDAAFTDLNKRAAVATIAREAWRAAPEHGVRLTYGMAEELAYAAALVSGYLDDEERVEDLAAFIDSIRLQAAKDRKREATREAMRKRRAQVDRSSAG